jgi:elongation factor 1-beta
MFAQVVSFKDQTKMAALAGITIKIMPESVDIDFEALKKKGEELVKDIYGEVREIKFEEEPIAFGLKALKIVFIVEETLGSDIMVEKMSDVEGVASVQCIGFQRLT